MKISHGKASGYSVYIYKKAKKTNQPVPCGKANIQPTDPPPDLEPNTPPITQLRAPQKHAEQKPREKHHERDFQEHRLRLRELLDGVEREERLGEAQRVVVNARIGEDCGIPLVEHARVPHVL